MLRKTTILAAAGLLAACVSASDDSDSGDSGPVAQTSSGGDGSDSAGDGGDGGSDSADDTGGGSSSGAADGSSGSDDSGGAQFPPPEEDPRALEGAFALAREYCEADLPVSFDWAGIEPNYEGLFGESQAWSWCEAVFSGLHSACTSLVNPDEAKAWVQANVAHVHCWYDVDATQEVLGRRGPSLMVSDIGLLEAGWNADSTNISMETWKWVQDFL